MAKQHFLQASFTGTIGGWTGSKTKGGSVIKQKKFPKCHNGETSNNSCRAFECLHRICCKVAPLLANTVLSKTTSSKRIGTLESLWKDWIGGSSFIPSHITNIPHLVLPYNFSGISYNEFTTTLVFDIQGTLDLLPNNEAWFMFFIYNEVGSTFAVHFYPYKDTQINIQLPGTVEHQLYLSSIILYKINGKWRFASPASYPIYIWQP